MVSRRKQREIALQALYQAEIKQITGQEALKSTLPLVGENIQDLAYALEVLQGVDRHKIVIDDLISKVSFDWRLERLANVDRNILRIALCELFFREDIPPSVAVNEALEIAKTYSTDESSRFVNGILGKVLDRLDYYKQEVMQQVKIQTSN